MESSALCSFLLLHAFLPFALATAHTYATLNRTCHNSATLPNTTLPDYNLTSTARFVAFFVNGTLDSINGTLPSGLPFFLAFVSFSPGSYLLAILANGIISDSAESLPDGATLRVVWTANANRPVADDASLQLAPDGNLLLWDADGSVAWSTRTSNAGVSSLQLTSAGILQLINGTNASVWQSSSAPSDSLLLGQTLEYQYRLSSLSSINRKNNVPSEKSYSLTMDAGGLALSAGSSLGVSQAYWAWGYYGNDTFSISHTCRKAMAAQLERSNDKLELNLYQGSTTVTSDTNSTALCSLNVDANATANYPLISTGLDNVTQFFLRLESDGNLRGYAYTSSLGWHIAWELFDRSVDGCLLPDQCGAYGLCVDPDFCNNCPIGDNGVALKSSNSGCSPNYKPTCNISSTNSTSLSTNGDQWKMLTISGVDYFATAYFNPASNITSKDACEQLCLNNCSCAAAFYHTSAASCFILEQLEGSLHHVSDVGKVAFLKLDPRDLLSTDSTNSSSRLSTKLQVIIGLVAGSMGSCLVVLIALKLYCIVRKKAGHSDSPTHDDASLEDQYIFELVGMMPTRFSYKELEVATHGFKEKLGHGGFGVVYKGVLPDGRAIAVKKSEGALQGHKEFHAEVAALGSIHHWHLVQLYGFCAEHAHRLLVYEYMANGSLAQWLFSPPHSRNAILDWDTRSNIALGMAKGLSYLHTECKEKIIHLDIKPQNVLLDGKFVAKVADFGLSRFVSREERSVVTTMRGTPGYVAPEWLLDSSITEMSDVYSYGMVLLEIVSGRKNQISPDKQAGNSDSIEGYCYFPALALRMLKENRELELVDARLGEAFDKGEAQKMLRIALLCVQEDSTKRPSMPKVVQMLDKEYGEVPEPPLCQNLHVFLEAHFRLLRVSSPISSPVASPNHKGHGSALLAPVDQNSYDFDYSLLSAR